MDEPKYPVHTVIKALDIIRILSKDTSNRGIGISDLSRELGLGKSTIHRILDTLLFYRYIDKNEETNRYRLGWELYTIGQMVPRQNQLYNLDNTYLIELSKQTKETVNVGILSNDEVVIISKIEGSDENLRVTMQPGDHEALHATGLGKILISELPEAKIRELVKEEKGKLRKFTNNTIISVNELLIEIEKVRKQGYAVDSEEYSVGLYCIAKPLRDYTGNIIAALSVSSPYARINESRIQEIVHDLDVSVQKISGTLGYNNKQNNNKAF